MKVNNTICSILLFLIVVTFNYGCSNKRNTSAARAYHELTTRYNIYHNAEKTYNRLIDDQLEISSIDWFNLLSVHPDNFNREKNRPGGMFDGVIEKTAKSIIEHSISSKPQRNPSKAQSEEYRQWLKQEEFNPFLKNSWLLMGKAFVQNGDYSEALSIFTEIQRIYHYDINLISETQLWMLRSYVALNRMYDAKNMIYLLQTRKLPSDLQKLYIQEYANFLIENKEYEEAIPHLKIAIDNQKHHIGKKRLQFLLGQIYYLTGDIDNAYSSFEKIKDIRTPPTINKNASIYQAVISKGTKLNKFYNDSLAQVINQNIQFKDNDLIESSGNSSNIYAIQNIVRVKRERQADPTTANKSESAKLLDKLMEELKQLNSETKINEKIVPLSRYFSTTASSEPDTTDSRVSPAELKSILEQKAEEALKQSNESIKNKSREQLFKEREKQREIRLKERERELKERERLREAQLRQREKEREEKIRQQKKTDK